MENNYEQGNYLLSVLTSANFQINIKDYNIQAKTWTTFNYTKLAHLDLNNSKMITVCAVLLYMLVTVIGLFIKIQKNK